MNLFAVRQVNQQRRTYTRKIHDQAIKKFSDKIVLESVMPN